MIITNINKRYRLFQTIGGKLMTFKGNETLSRKDVDMILLDVNKVG